MLGEMGLVLDDKQVDDVLNVIQAVQWDPTGVQNAIQTLLTNAITMEGATSQNNPVLWWMAILVRSAISTGDDYISHGSFNLNILPEDLDIRDRGEAMGHYSKVLILDRAFRQWDGRHAWVMQIQRDLNLVNNEWLNREDGPRPDGGMDTRTCSSIGWTRMLEHLQQEGETWLGGPGKTAMSEIGRLRRDLRRVEEQL